MSVFYEHHPVMVDHVVRVMSPVSGEVMIDATYGGGGHARALLSGSGAEAIAIDRDPEAIARAREACISGLYPVQGCFSRLDEIAIEAGRVAVDGVLLDIGVSSFQLASAERGFSFMQDGPLDMRMGSSGLSAAEAVNGLAEKDLASIFRHLGEEPAADRLASEIVRRRRLAPFSGTLELASLAEASGCGGGGRHPATRIFQALRIFINDELGELERALVASERILKPGGRLAVICFHSLEDRMVKAFLRSRSGLGGRGSRHIPEVVSSLPGFVLVERRCVRASPEEVASNPGARSARLRWAVRNDNPPLGDVGGVLPPVPRVGDMGMVAA